jgi:glutamate-1-semialdehyde aminotransferase
MSLSLEDPITTIMKAKTIYAEMKKENSELRERLAALAENNRKLTAIVEEMGGMIEMMKSKNKEKYYYNYSKGGWLVNDGIDDSKLHLRSGFVSIEAINDQLGEIMKIMKKHGMETGTAGNKEKSEKSASPETKSNLNKDGENNIK